MTMFDEAVPVHHHGYIKLLDTMGSDQDIVDAARVSYDRRGVSKDRALIRFLLRHKHTSPFEMGLMKFEVAMPIFVARQWVRHRTASMNEVSARYTQLPDHMFVPEVISLQSTDNKQGRKDLIESDLDERYRALIDDVNNFAYSAYEQMLADGVSREMARGVLPLNIYTKFVWLMDLHNLMHFLKLRLDSHAQDEIRDYATVIEGIMGERFPITHEAFVDYIRDSYTLSRMEVDTIQRIIEVYNDEFSQPVALSSLTPIEDIAKQQGVGGRDLTEFLEKFGG